MKTVRTIAMAALFACSAGTLLAQSNSDAPLLGDQNYEQNPVVILQDLQNNPDSNRVLEILDAHKTWERANVEDDGKYVNDRAVIQVEKDGTGFKIKTIEKGTVDSKLIHGDTFQVWNYSETNAEWVRQNAKEIRENGIEITVRGGQSGTMKEPAFWQEGPSQWRFPVRIAPKTDEEFDEARLVVQGSRAILYLMKPGTNEYEEEWILKD